MIYNELLNERLSLLGFGTMRLPLLPDGAIDEQQVEEMVAYAMQHGVNYFDTAYPYHGGKSERVIGKILEKYPRNSFYLADKYPGHLIADSFDPAATFEEQLRRCRVNYFDFYLLHNVCEDSIQVYMDERWKIMEYFLEQKRLGRIKHLGFSSHGLVDNLNYFLDHYGREMEFCQIQLNYIDWTLQEAKSKYEILTQRGIPVWVMEPVRGGKLANLPGKMTEQLQQIRPKESVAAWAFRWLQRLPNVKMILSGMSNLAQMEDNIRTFDTREALTDEETDMVMGIANQLHQDIPCTACRYCCDGCPQQLDIPTLIAAYNDFMFAPSFGPRMLVESLPEEKKPSACLQCGRCTHACPQKINIPEVMQHFVTELAKHPTWVEVCIERAKEQANGE